MPTTSAIFCVGGSSEILCGQSYFILTALLGPRHEEVRAHSLRGLLFSVNKLCLPHSYARSLFRQLFFTSLHLLSVCNLPLLAVVKLKETPFRSSHTDPRSAQSSALNSPINQLPCSVFSYIKKQYPRALVNKRKNGESSDPFNKSAWRQRPNRRSTS